MNIFRSCYWIFQFRQNPMFGFILLCVCFQTCHLLSLVPFSPIFGYGSEKQSTEFNVYIGDGVSVCTLEMQSAKATGIGHWYHTMDEYQEYEYFYNIIKNATVSK